MIHPVDQNIYNPYLRLVDYALERLKSEGKEIVMLDAGCGHSTVLEEQYKQCSKVIGVDLDRLGLNKNKLIHKKLFSDLGSIPLPDNSVDIIVSAWVFEHVEKPEAVVKDFDRVLKPGGYIVFITPNIDGWYATIANMVPNALHDGLARFIYKRGENDTFKVHYKMNSEEDIGKLLDDLESKSKYKQIEMIYNDDPKYIGFNILFKPIASLWHRIVMTKRMERLRVHLVGLYKKGL